MWPFTKKAPEEPVKLLGGDWKSILYPFTAHDVDTWYLEIYDVPEPEYELVLVSESMGEPKEYRKSNKRPIESWTLMGGADISHQDFYKILPSGLYYTKSVVSQEGVEDLTVYNRYDLRESWIIESAESLLNECSNDLRVATAKLKNRVDIVEFKNNLRKGETK